MWKKLIVLLTARKKGTLSRGTFPNYEYCPRKWEQLSLALEFNEPSPECKVIGKK